MKNKLLAILIFASSLAFAQNNQYKGAAENQYATVTYIPWQQEGQVCYGCPSFYWSVTKSVLPTPGGYYVYDVWFASNSWLWDYTTNQGVWTSTYVSGIQVTCDGYFTRTDQPWLTFKEKFAPTMMRFYSRNETPLITFRYADAKVY